VRQDGPPYRAKARAALFPVLIALAGVPGHAVRAAEGVDPAAPQDAARLLRDVPEGVHPQGFAVGVTDVLREAVKAGIARVPARLVPGENVPRPAEVTLDQAVRLGLPSVTGLRLPADLPKIVEDQRARADAIRKRLGQAIRPASRLHARPRTSLSAAEGATPDPNAEWFDWRNLDVVTAVKNQKTCGCCWAFATVGAYEASYAIRNNRLIDASEQFVLNCNAQGYSCGGGLWAYDLFLSTGVPTTRQLGYADPPGKQSCVDPGNGPFRAKVWEFLPGSATAVPPVGVIKQVLCDHGPVTVAIDATDNFLRYKGGVFSENASPYADALNPTLLSVNHAIVIVGWDDAKIVPRDPSRTAWAIKNSWGPTWGLDRGFAWVRSDTNNVGNAASYVDAAEEPRRATAPPLAGSPMPTSVPSVRSEKPPRQVISEPRPDRPAAPGLTEIPPGPFAPAPAPPPQEPVPPSPAPNLITSPPPPTPPAPAPIPPPVPAPIPAPSSAPPSRGAR